MSESVPSPSKNEKNQTEVWLDLTEKLTKFASSSNDLVESLKRSIEESKKNNGPITSSQGDLLCKCLEFIDTEVVPSTKSVSIERSAEVSDSFIEQTTKGPALVQVKNKTVNRTSVKRTPTESFATAKADKLLRLKDNLKTTQQNLIDIQEQVRQLERLYQDYDSPNTSEGKVNTAALYREIMKPQSVPYVGLTKSALSQKSECGSKSLPGNSRYISCKGVHEKVSILSADVPKKKF